MKKNHSAANKTLKKKLKDAFYRRKIFFCDALESPPDGVLEADTRLCWKGV